MSISDNHSAAWFYLADIYEKTNQVGLSRDSLKKARQYGFNDKDCTVLEGKILYREEELNGALEKLEEVVVTENDTFEAACQVLFLRGKVYDRLGDTEKAFENFQRSNEQFSKSIEASQANPGKYLKMVQANRNKFSKSWLDSWQDLPDPGEWSPAFILGFPRSGTT